MDFLDDTMEMSDEERFRNHYRFFKSLDSRTLVILDNFDSVPEDEDMFHEFLSMSFQVLVTTRSHITEAVCYQVKEIENIEDLKRLFFTYAPSTIQQPEMITEIIEEVYRHTLTVELAAKTLTASGMEASVFLQALRTEGLSLSNPNKVVLTKDNISHKRRLYQHIQTLFQIQGLSPEAFDTLRNMVLMPKKGISKVLFHTWQGKQDWNTTNDLVEYGWIQEDTVHNQILLHPYLHEILLTETAPYITKCANLLKGIFENCIVYGMDVPYYHALLNTIESIYYNITLDDAVSAAMFMDTTMAYLAKYGRMEAVETILSLMKNLPDYGENTRHTAICDCYAGYVEYRNSNYQKAKQHYLHGLELLEPFHPVNADLVSNLKNNLGQTYLALGERQAALSAIEEAISIRQKYGTVSSHDTLVQGFSYAQMIAANGNWQEARKRLFALIRFVKKIEGMNLFLAQLYRSLAVIESKRLPEDSLQHYRKAKQALLDGFFPENHPEIQKINQEIQKEELLIHRLNRRKQRFLCRECNRTFMQTTNTLMANSHYGHSLWADFIRDTLCGDSLDKSAQKYGFSHQTAFNMRHKVLMALQNLLETEPVILSGTAEFDETFVLDCYKGAAVPEETGRKARKHCAKAEKRGISNEYVAICTGIQRDGGAIAATVNRAKPSSKELGKIFQGHIAENTLILTDGLHSYNILENLANCTVVDVNHEEGRGALTSIP